MNKTVFFFFPFFLVIYYLIYCSIYKTIQCKTRFYFGDSLVSITSENVIYREPNQPAQEDQSSTGPLLVVIQTPYITEEIRQFADSIALSGTNASVVVISSDGTFGDYRDTQELSTNETYKVIHCDSKISTSLVFSVIAYSQNDRVAIVNWNAIATEDQDSQKMYIARAQYTITHCKQTEFLKEKLLQSEAGSFYLGIYLSSTIRSIISSPCFKIEYRYVNPLSELSKYQMIFLSLHKSSCSVRTADEPPNNHTAVIFTVFKRDYWESVLTSICSQSLPPTMLVFIQNEAHQRFQSSKIPAVCKARNIELHHVWLSNWNSFCYMRHYLLIPSNIHNTVLVDDDQVLTHEALESGIRYMRENQCLTSERGGVYRSRTEGHANWKIVTSGSINAKTFVDYAFIPFYEDSEWRKSVYGEKPNSPVFGDILFASNAIFFDKKIPACVYPSFKFFEKDEGEDVLSTSKKNSALYDFHYDRIANFWMDRGYQPVFERS